MSTCYISAPFGKKSDPSSGLFIDFDDIYQTGIRPAVEAAGLTAVRGDALQAGALIQKDVISAVLGSDIMIADLTTANPNVLYEVGVRHAARRGSTILVLASTGRFPFDIGYFKVLVYELGPDGVLDSGAAERLAEALRRELEAAMRHPSIDSPVFALFPGYDAILPPEVASPRHKRGLRSAVRASVPAPETLAISENPQAQLRQLESEARGAPDLDPTVYITLLRQYRDLSEWDDMVRLADELPPEMRESPEVLQLQALALNRRRAEGDRDRAVGLMKQLIARTGGDGETFGILGRIFKDRYDETHDPGDLHHAIQYYRQGFEKDPDDFYPGLNAVTLLLQRGDEASLREMQELLPRVRTAVDRKVDTSMAGYWEYATALHLACVARDWDRARRYAGRAMAQNPAAWMVETTLRDLRTLQRAMGPQPGDAGSVDDIIRILDVEGRHAAA